MYASGVANAFLYSFVPSLFVEAYGAQVSDLAWLTAAAPLCNSVCCVLSGILADRLAKSWPTHRCRMLMQLLGTALPALCLVTICSSESRFSVSILLTLWMGTHGFQTSGLTALFHDVAHTRASELFAIGNVFSKFAGILAGPMFSRNAALWGWKCVLCGLSVHYAMSGIVLISLMHRSKEAGKLFSTEEKLHTKPVALKMEQTSTGRKTAGGQEEPTVSLSPDSGPCSELPHKVPSYLADQVPQMTQRRGRALG